MRGQDTREDADRSAQRWLDDQRFPCRWCGARVRYGDAVKYTDGSVAHEECDRAVAGGEPWHGDHEIRPALRPERAAPPGVHPASRLRASAHRPEDHPTRALDGRAGGGADRPLHSVLRDRGNSRWTVTCTACNTSRVIPVRADVARALGFLGFEPGRTGAT